MLGLLFAAFVAVEYFRPKPVDWSHTFASKDKIPYGTYITYHLLQDIFKGQSVSASRLPVLNQLELNPDFKGSYIFINHSFEADSLNLNAMLDFVQQGNQVFIAAEYFSENLEDTLGFSTDYLEYNKASDTLHVQFTNASLKAPAFKFPNDALESYFVIDSLQNQLALGKMSSGELNFIKIPFGRGAFYLSSVPLAFTNLYLLDKSQTAYAAIAFSHLPVQPVLWDEYQKIGSFDNTSVIRVLVSHEALGWAYYIALFAIVLYVLFESKRTQRIIPVQEPPQNTTLEFVQVIGNLYFNHKNHKTIAEKKINFFLEHLRSHYYENAHQQDEELQERIASKSGADISLVQAIFEKIHHIRTSDTITEHRLLDLNKQLEEFYNQTSVKPMATRSH